MKKPGYLVLSLTLLAALSRPAMAGPVPDKVHRLWNGIRQLQHTHTILDSEAGSEYGGHREAAEKDIDAALDDLSQAVEFFRINVAHQTNPYPPPELQPEAEPGGDDPDHIHRLRRGIQHLNQARHILDGMAGDEYGGHRAAAEQEIAAAQGELQAALAFARSHPH